jgi:hypothetical protein
LKNTGKPPQPHCRKLAEEVAKGQKRINDLTEVNRHLKTTLVKKKIQVQELRAKIDAIVESLGATCGVENDARQNALEDVEESILAEEKAKQEMMLELNQKIQECNDQLNEMSTTNNALEAMNMRKKKLMKEQQVEIKDRNKAIRHLERQILVLAGATKQNMSKQEECGASGKQDGNVFSDGIDAGSAAPATPKAVGTTDSKSLLRGAQAEKHLQEQKRRLEEQRLQSRKTLEAAGRNAADLKSLPGLNLSSLLGMDEQSSAFLRQESED